MHSIYLKWGNEFIKCADILISHGNELQIVHLSPRYTFFTHHMWGSVDLRFKMPSNSAFKPGYNGLDKLNSTSKPLSMENKFILLSLVIRTLWLRDCSHFPSPDPHKQPITRSSQLERLSLCSCAWLRSNVFLLYLPQEQIESQSVVDSPLQKNGCTSQNRNLMEWRISSLLNNKYETKQLCLTAYLLFEMNELAYFGYMLA